MTERVESEILIFKKSLEKALLDGSEVELDDILTSLEEIPMTVDLLR